MSDIIATCPCGWPQMLGFVHIEPDCPYYEAPPVTPENIAAVAEGQEITTGELAVLAGVTPATLRKWKKRGDIANAPLGRSGAGRGNELLWSPRAVEEVLQRAAEHRDTSFRRQLTEPSK